MDQKQARKLIGSTFQNKFDKAKFAKFIAEFLTGVNFGKATGVLSGNVIRAAFQDRIASYERIAQYIDPDNKVVDILVVNLKRDTTLERGRTGLRNFAADYLQTDRGTGKSAVLLAYVSPERSEWRFSFVSLETALVQTEKGTFKEAIESITPARRKSFLVGEFERTHTAQSRFHGWLQKREGPTLQQIEDCFDVESVTKEFFGKYKQLFERTRDAILGACETDKKVRSEFITKGMYELDDNGKKVPFADDFAKKLLGQIVFLYFLQKKGWFGVPRDEDWGSGDRNFLRSLFDNRSRYKPHTLKRDLNFYEDILEPLFYNTLAIKRTHDWSDRFHCKIPFLNGGLFEAIYGYDWSAFELLLPDALFSNKKNTGDEGDGILDVFDLYNFTINEAEPLETEVAVDPEMLGKIFENLLPENVRHGSGTYYTPRVIVAYMSQQSLINYLSTHLPDISREDIETFIKFGAIAADYTEGGTAKDKDKYLPDAIVQNAVRLEELLKKITVCDPAIGSGAFPVGMMQEIVKAREALRGCDGIQSSSQYQLKRETIENCLYGVDIDPGAVEIAKLRLWLSLIVDEVDYQTIEPLPNLDYKIMQGNSLLDEFHGVPLINDSIFAAKGFDRDARIAEINSELAKLQIEIKALNYDKSSVVVATLERRIKELVAAKNVLARDLDVLQGGMFQPENDANAKLETLKAKMRHFVGEPDADKKKALREEIDSLEWQFIEAKLSADGNTSELAELTEAQAMRQKPYFLWRLNYPEVFQKGGFDVIIANPPYVKEDVNKRAFDGLHGAECYQGKMDLWYLFGCRALGLFAKPNGLICLIATNNWISNDGASRFRNKMVSDSRILNVLDFGNYMVFDASVQTMVFVFAKSSTPLTYPLTYGRLTNDRAEPRTLKAFLESRTPARTTDFTKYPVQMDRNQMVDSYLRFIPESVGQITRRMTERSTLNLREDEIHSGIDVMQDFVSRTHLSKLDPGIKKGAGIFVLSDAEKESVPWTSQELSVLKPYYTTSEIGRYHADPVNKYWIIYLGSTANKEIHRYPNIRRHLDRFESVITSVNKPYGLHRTRREEIFLGRKILSIRKCLRPTFSLVDFPCYVARPFLIVKTERFDLKYLLALLNSKLISFWLFHKGKLQGNQFQIDIIPLTQIPLVEAKGVIRSQIVERADEILDTRLNRSPKDIAKAESEIDRLIYDLYGLSTEERALVEQG